MKDMPWDHGLRVSADDGGLVGHAKAVLPRQLVDRAGLTAALGAALARAGKFPLARGPACYVQCAATAAPVPDGVVAERGRERLRVAVV